MFAKSIKITRLLLLICIVFESCLSIQSKPFGIVTRFDDPEKELRFHKAYFDTDEFNRRWDHDHLLSEYDEYGGETILGPKAPLSSLSISEDQTQSSKIPEQLTETKSDFLQLPEFPESYHEHLTPDNESQERNLLLESEEKPDNDNYHNEWYNQFLMQETGHEVTPRPEENLLSDLEKNHSDLKDQKVNPADVEHVIQNGMEIIDSKNYKINYEVMDQIIAESFASNCEDILRKKLSDVSKV